jgi:hypothetical protein
MEVILERKYDCKIINGNVLTGNTFPIKEFIKRKLDGKWDAERKVWIVNEQTVQKYLDLGVIKRRVVEEVALGNSKVAAQGGYRKQYTHTRAGGGYDASGSWVSDDENNDF